MYNCTNQSIYPVRSNDVLTGQKFLRNRRISGLWFVLSMWNLKKGGEREREKKGKEWILCGIESITMRSVMVFENMNGTRRTNEQMTEYAVYEGIRTKAICNFYEMLRKMWFVCTLNTILQHLLLYFATRWLSNKYNSTGQELLRCSKLNVPCLILISI